MPSRSLRSLLTCLPLLGLLAIAPCLRAQAYTAVSGTTVQSGFGVPLSSGIACFQPITSATGAIATITPSGGPAQSAPFCGPVTNGAFAFATVPNLTTATPTGILYTLTLYNGSGATVLGIAGVSIAGSSWSFDSYVIGITPYPTGPSAYGIGLPYSLCAVGASFTNTATSSPSSGWNCTLSGMSGTIWYQGGTGVTPTPAGILVTVPVVAQMIQTVPGVTSIVVSGFGGGPPSQGAITLTAGAGIQILHSGSQFFFQSTATATGINVAMPTTSISANTCVAQSPISQTGITVLSSFAPTFASDPSAAAGWGANGGLVPRFWPTLNNINWKVCNQSASPITPGAISMNIGVIF